MYYAYDGAAPPSREGGSHATICPYGPFETGDGSTILMGLQNEREWARFCDQVLGDPALARDPRFETNALRLQHKSDLNALILACFSTLSGAQVMLRLDAAGIANARMNDMAGLWTHGQLQARGRWTSVDSPSGPLPALQPPGQTEARMGPIPALGAHSHAILRELGLTPDQIAALEADGVI